MANAGKKVAMGVLFYPRGGSAQVARYLSRALEQEGWPVFLLSGSLGKPGERTHAPTFYSGVRVADVDYNAAIDAYDSGRDPIAEPVPLHPSFEDQGDVPDRVFAAVSDELGNHLASVWERIMAELWIEDPAVLHLHHLTPLQEAARRRFANGPLVTHLHGTEIKMLDRIERLSEIARALGLDLAEIAERAGAGELAAGDRLPPEQRELFEQTRWQSWRFGDHWAERLRAAARLSDRFVVISPHDRDEAHRLLEVNEEQVEWIPNGVDIRQFDRQTLTPDERLERWRRWLIEDAHGWDESGEPGSIRYDEEDLRQLVDSGTGDPPPALLYVGRFLEFKRVPLLVRAYARARPRFAVPAPLVIWGGFPGELEGEHPHTVAREEGVEGVFFVGWRGHDDLPEGFACADLLVAPSHNEPFGQVYLEAMACAVPVIATRSGGPLSYVNTEPGRPNGWLVEPDDVGALADALVEAVNSPEKRRQRAENAYEQIRAGYSWDHLAERFVGVYERVIAAHSR
jgi:D-inositol-3-phosphate glycosyltransferase